MTRAPQTASHHAVGIFFHDRTISAVFGELLASRGVQASLLSTRGELTQHTSVVTEARYYQFLSPTQRATSLIVGDEKSLKEVEAITLEQPLTEAKVESALAQFLQLH